MAGQPLLAATNGPKRGPTAAASQQAKSEGRVLHALNRLTFGPRPGDVAAVKAMGLSTWFEMQLNPSKIDDSALDARLGEFPAMQLQQRDLIARFPNTQMIQQMERRRQAAAEFRPGAFGRRFGGLGPVAAGPNPLLSDPVERAIYDDQLAFYRAQQVEKAAKDAAAGSGQSNATAVAAMTPSMEPGPTVREAKPDYDTPAVDKMDGGPAPVMAKQASTIDGQPSTNNVDKLYKDLGAVKIINLPPDQRMKRVIAMAPEEFVSFRQSLTAPEAGAFNQGLNPEQRETFEAMQNATRMVGSEDMQARLIRDIYSDRQLEAVMTDFWLNHFNVYLRKNQDEAYLIPSFERDVIRPNALGKFEDLLVATAESPAMLMYLDNWQSIGPDSQAAKNGSKQARLAQNPQVKAALKDRGLNENYGRELMELHTVGVNGGYTQKDVTEVAKVFTGWTMTPPAQGAQFQFDERKHEPGPKTVMGVTIQEGGMKEGLQVLHMLATSPATAKFISTKLAERFVADDPPQSLVQRMSQTFLSSGGDIKAVLRTMFESPEFWAPAADRAKVKTPEEFLISAVRASGANVSNAMPLVQALDRLGMPLYGMQTPNGYSWKSDSWVSTGALVNRMNFALLLAGNRVPGVKTEWSQELKRVKLDPDKLPDSEVAGKERRLEAVLFQMPLNEKTRTTVLAEADNSTAAAEAAKNFPVRPPKLGPAAPVAGGQAGRVNPDDSQAAVMAGLMLGSPEFQKR